MTLATTHLARAQDEGGLLIPMGGGYSDLYPGLMTTLAARAQDGALNIVVLPTPYSTSAAAITPGEVEINMRDAETRRKEIEGACQRAAADGIECHAVIAPIFTRADAENPDNLVYFDGNVTAVFILGGDQMVAMQVLANSPVEEALAAIYARGGVIAGTSAGAAVQSRTMIADYSPNYGIGRSFDAGAAAIWQDAAQRGLDFGVQRAILDQHFFQRGRLGRLVGAIVRPDTPHVGVGVDAYTGVQVANATLLTNTFGLYTVAVLDADTYGAAGSAQSVGEREWLSVRNLLVHLLAPGAYGYDLSTRRHSLAAPTPAITRTLALTLPAGAGPLFVAGGLEAESPVYDQFAATLGDDDAPLLVVATGYPNDRAAQRAADRIAARFTGPVTTTVVSSKSDAPLTLTGEYRGMIVTGRDQSLLQVERLTALRARWLDGAPLLLDSAAAAIAGAHYSAHAPTPEEGEAAEKAAQRSFLEGRTAISAGLALLPVAVEPDVVANNRWGRLFSLAYAHPAAPAIGLGQGAALVIRPDGAEVVGDEVVVSLDLRPATLAWGANRAFVIANGLLDVFAPGDTVVYVAARQQGP